MPTTCPNLAVLSAPGEGALSGQASSLGARGAIRGLLASPWIDGVAVTAVAAATRLSGLDTAPWDHNQAEILNLVDPIVDKGEWPAVGWEISGRFGGALPALLFWILALPRFVTLSPMALVGFGAFFDVAAAALTYVIGRKLFGRAGGLAAGLLYAFDATLIAHAQILWNVTMLPFFTALLVLGLVLVLVEGRSWGVVLVLAGLSMAIQIHLLTAYLLPPVVLLALVFRPRPRLAHVVVGLVLALATWWPYLDHEARHGFPNLRAAREIAAAVFTGSDVPRMEVAPTHFNDGVLARGVTLRGAEYPYLPTRFLPSHLEPAFFLRAFDASTELRAALAGLGAVALVWQSFRRRGSAGAGSGRAAPTAALLLASYGFPVALLALARFRIYDRYLLPLHPLSVLLAVAGLSSMFRGLERLATHNWGLAGRQRACWAGAIAAALALVAWSACQWCVVRATRSEARATGLLANDGTLGAKLDIARLLIQDIGLDVATFTRDTTFFAWPGRPAPDRHRGFRQLFRYWMEEVQVKRRVDKPDGPRYLIVYRGEAAQVTSDICALEEYERELFTVIRVDDAAELGFARRGSIVPANWARTGGSTEGWSVANFPLSWGGASAIPEHVEAQYLEVPIELREARQHALLVLQTRECVGLVSLNGEVLASGECPPGRARDERESMVHAYPLGGRWSVGTNVLRIELVVRYSTASVDAYLLPLRNPDRLLQPPPEIVRFARFVSPDPLRFRVPVDPVPRGWEPIGLPAPSSVRPDDLVSVGPDTAAAVSLAAPMWSLPTWQVRFSFLSSNAYLLALVRPFPRNDFRSFWGVGIAVRASGTGSAFRLVLRDRDGDEWRYHDSTVMWEEGWKALAVPFTALQRDPTQSAGDHELDLGAIEAVMIQLVPGSVGAPLRDQELRFTTPVLLRDPPDRARAGWGPR